MIRSVLILSLLAVPGAALAAGGAGGVVFHQEGLLKDAPDAPAAGVLSCVGGMGYRLYGRTRVGGEGHACANDVSSMSWGGVYLARQSLLRGVGYTTWGTSLNLGALEVRDSGGIYRESTFVTLRPQVGVGLPLFGFTSVEVTGYLSLPVAHVYELSQTGATRSNLGHVGVQVSFLFGDFRRERKPEPEPAPVVAKDGPPPAPAYVEPPPPPPEDDRPLAIPAGEPPPPRR